MVTPDCKKLLGYQDYDGYEQVYVFDLPRGILLWQEFLDLDSVALGREQATKHI